MKYHGWAIVEIMGHRRRVGLVSEESIAGVTMLRIEVPVAGKLEETRPEFYPGTSIFGMRPISAEEAAAELARGAAPPAPSPEAGRSSTAELRALLQAGAGLSWQPAEGARGGYLVTRPEDGRGK